VETIFSVDFRDVAPGHAVVPVLDRGLLFGDSVFEVVRTYGGRPLLLREHLLRLAQSARLVRFPFEPDLDRLEAEARRMLGRWAREAGGEARMRILVTRGRGEALLEPGDAHEPSTVIVVRPLAPPDEILYEKGATAAVVSVRRNLSEALPPAAKTANYLNNLLALMEARSLGAYEPLMLDHLGRVAEGATSNVFAVRGRELVTPCGDTGILGGITRGALLALAVRAELQPREVELRPEELVRADEVMITSTAREVLPIVGIAWREAWHAIGAGRPGPAAARLRALYREWAVTRAG